ncbi:MAG: histidinol-phosphatase HisJ family protein [Eubacteriales bacterium]|nr:histidinol-phosphatase HisJ family protein [Eubacteriales bacterium]
MKQLSDWHMHTSFSSDSKASIDTMAQRAVALGLSSVCFTDHNDYDYPEYYEDGTMQFQLDISRYIKAAAAAQKKYDGQLKIYIGVEQGLQPHLHEKINNFDSDKQLDFIIGSSHLVDGADPYYPKYWDSHEPAASINRYFDYILENLAVCHNFDVYGHLDYIIRYAPGQDSNYNWENYKERIDAILKMLIYKGKGIEINTGGLKYGLKETNPAYGILKRYKNLGGEIITIGSDAHKPEHLAYDFNLIPDILKNAGFDYYTIFIKRQPHFIKL